MTNDTLVVIPARLGSTRLPKKILADLGGLPVVERCRRSALEARLGPVLVATDSPLVASALKPFGAEVTLTPARCPSGTDRVWEAARHWHLKTGRRPRFVINLQADEPFIRPQTLRSLAAILRDKRHADIATALTPLDPRGAGNPNTVKVAWAQDGRCLYFSRAPIPYPRHLSGNGAAPYYKHIGVYGFQWESLKRFVRTPASPLECREGLEQLRALEAGMHILGVRVSDATISIDTIQDLALARRLVRERGVRAAAPIDGADLSGAAHG